MTREKTHVLKALDKHMGERSISSFNDWLEDFYREFKGFVKQTMKPAILALAEAVRAISAQEVGIEEKEADAQELLMTISNARRIGMSSARKPPLGN